MLCVCVFGLYVSIDDVSMCLLSVAHVLCVSVLCVYVSCDDVYMCMLPVVYILYACVFCVYESFDVGMCVCCLMCMRYACVSFACRRLLMMSTCICC